MAPTVAVTVVTSTTAGAGAVVSGAASVVVDAPQPAAIKDEPRMQAAARAPDVGNTTIHDGSLQRAQERPQFLLQAHLHDTKVVATPACMPAMVAFSTSRASAS